MYSRVQKLPRVRGGSYTGTPNRRVPLQKSLLLIVLPNAQHQCNDYIRTSVSRKAFEKNDA